MMKPKTPYSSTVDLAGNNVPPLEGSSTSVT